MLALVPVPGARVVSYAVLAVGTWLELVYDPKAGATCGTVLELVYGLYN